MKINYLFCLHSNVQNLITFFFFFTLEIKLFMIYFEKVHSLNQENFLFQNHFLVFI